MNKKLLGNALMILGIGSGIFSVGVVMGGRPGPWLAFSLSAMMLLVGAGLVENADEE